MDNDEAVLRLQQLESCHDIDERHYLADDILLEFLKRLGHQDIVDAFNKLEKIYS